MQHSSSKYGTMPDEDEYAAMEEDDDWQSGIDSEGDVETEQMVNVYRKATPPPKQHTVRDVTPSVGFDSMHAYEPEWSLRRDTTEKNEYVMPEVPEEYNDELPKYNGNNMLPRLYTNGVSSTKYNDMPGAKKHPPMTEEKKQLREKELSDSLKYLADLTSQRERNRVLLDDERVRQNRARHHALPAQLHATTKRQTEQNAILKQFCEITNCSETKGNVILVQYGYNLRKALDVYMN